MINVYGSTLLCQTFLVADATATMELILWGQEAQQAQTNQCYQLTEVRVKVHQDQKKNFKHERLKINTDNGHTNNLQLLWSTADLHSHWYHHPNKNQTSFNMSSLFQRDPRCLSEKHLHEVPKLRNEAENHKHPAQHHRKHQSLCIVQKSSGDRL